MTLQEREEALLTGIAARLEWVLAGLHLSYAKVFLRGRGRIHLTTISRIMHARDHRLSTLVAFADAVDCDVEVIITPRAKPQDIHDHISIEDVA